jgi:superfamily II RNA helicase
MDTLGHVVILSDMATSRSDALRLASAPPEPLLSRFALGYGSTLHLLAHRSDAQVRDFLRRGFGPYLAAARRADAAEHERDTESAWRRFGALRAVLEEYGYVLDGHPTPRAATAMAIRARNELLVAEALREDAPTITEPAHFAGALIALVTEPSLTARETETLARDRRLSASPATVALVDRIKERARQLRQAQLRHRVDVPVAVVDALSGLTEAWASRTPWEAVLAATTLDEGDLIYALRSLIDLLRQIDAAPGLDPAVRGLARRAIAAIDRDPVDQVM